MTLSQNTVYCLQKITTQVVLCLVSLVLANQQSSVSNVSVNQSEVYFYRT